MKLEMQPFKGDSGIHNLHSAYKKGSAVTGRSFAPSDKDSQGRIS